MKAKRVLDITVSLSLLALLWPVMLLAALAIKLDSSGPILFKQARLGLRGRAFDMMKFRTMVVGAEQIGTGLYNFEDDPRVTRVGRILRIASIDELPQLFNVLSGTMSLVGPRPPVTYELGDLGELEWRKKRRFVVRPGVTGLAQINGRNELSWDQKIAHDLEYIEKLRKYGILLDIYILLRTIIRVLRMDGSHDPPTDA